MKSRFIKLSFSYLCHMRNLGAILADFDVKGITSWWSASRQLVNRAAVMTAVQF